MGWQEISVPIRDGMVTFEGDPKVHRAVEPGWYDLISLPLLIPGSDGGPARAILCRLPA